MVFALVKPLLNERTISKIHIYGHDSSVWKEALVASIPADCLPVSYGGTKTDPIGGNPDCSSLVCVLVINVLVHYLIAVVQFRSTWVVKYQRLVTWLTTKPI